MIYKEYGKTGKKVSAIGCGGMRFLKRDYEKDIDTCAEIVLRAQELGINYFDTAPGYCDDKSELIFGRAFAQMKGEYYVSTKCALWDATNADEARRMLEQSLTRLHRDTITFYNLWCIKRMEEYERFMQKGGVYEGIVKAQEEGLVEHICFTTHLAGEDIAKIAQTGLFAGVTLGYNAVNFAYRQAGVDACAKERMGIVTMNPLGGGIIPQNPEYFSFIRGNSSDSITVAALKFIVSQPSITVALPGVSSIEELEEDVLAAENLEPMREGYLEEMAKNLGSELNSLCTGCSYCNECPSEVPIPKLLESYNMYILSGGKDKAITARLGDHWGISADQAQKCIQCGKCEKLCTQKLPIMERLAHIARIS